MTKSIPVFSFVFAAYAATSGKECIAVEGRGLAGNPRNDNAEDFVANWRRGEPGGAPMMVKISVSFNAKSGKSRLTRAGSVGASDIVWLGEIAETAHGGFSGRVLTASRRLDRFQTDRRVRFERQHVLGWSFGVEAKILPASGAMAHIASKSGQ